MALRHYYRFRAGGRTAEGVRVTCSGHVCGEPADETGPIPIEIRKAAKAVILAQLPTFKFNVEAHPEVTAYPAIRRLRRVPWNLRGKKTSLSFPSNP